jgi:predicted ester cyclase
MSCVSGKELVRRLVDVINARDWSQLDQLCTAQLAPKLRAAFDAFEQAFPDWQQDIIELVEEPPTVVARFRCSGTQTGDWLGLPASGRTMRVDEVSFIRVSAGRISGMWGLEDTWTRMRQLAGDNVTLGDLGSLS